MKFEGWPMFLVACVMVAIIMYLMVWGICWSFLIPFKARYVFGVLLACCLCKWVLGAEIDIRK